MHNRKKLPAIYIQNADLAVGTPLAQRGDLILTLAAAARGDLNPGFLSSCLEASLRPQ